MKIETLKQSHLKRNIIIGVGVVLVISAVILNFTKAKYRVTESIPLVTGTINYTLPDIQITELYIDGVAATELDSTKNYTLDTTNSTCTYKDGTEITDLTLSYDSSTKTFTIAPYTTKGTKCKLYFNEVTSLNLDVSLASIEISEGSSSNKLYVSGGGLSEQVEIDNTTPIVITGTTTTNGITVNSGTSNITLSNVDINLEYDINYSSALKISNGIVNLTLEETNNLYSNAGYISGVNLSNASTLTIDGSGSLGAQGIYMSSNTSLIINGGEISSRGGVNMPGIGGASDFALIEINGGNITATSAGYGAGIGGSAHTSVTGIIRINGGTVYAEGGSWAAGIGGGGMMDMECSPQATASNIYISDNANVTAVGSGTCTEDEACIEPDDIGNGGVHCG